MVGTTLSTLIDDEDDESCGGGRGAKDSISGDDDDAGVLPGNPRHTRTPEVQHDSVTQNA